MVALRSLTDDERDDMLDELAQTQRDRTRFSGALRRRHISAPLRAKLETQVAACDRHMDRFQRELSS